MFNRGVNALLEALPSLSNLSRDRVRRLLTLAWLEATDLRLDNTEQGDGIDFSRDLRRLATALEVHAILPVEIALATVQACAFVAAEALTIANELASHEARDQLSWIFGSVPRFERVEAGLLY